MSLKMENGYREKEEEKELVEKMSEKVAEPSAKSPTTTAAAAAAASAATEEEEDDDVMHAPPPASALRRKTSFAQGDVFKYRKAFDHFDHNKEGMICAKHLANIITRVGYRVPQKVMVEILEKHGFTEQSKITFEAFLDMVPRNYKHISEDEHRLADLREKFQRYDSDGNGVISLSEAQWALQSELKVSPHTALRLLNQFVRLNYEQFIEFYGKIQDTKLEIYDKFGKYDRDQDGLISVEEAYEVLHKELGFNHARTENLVSRFDLNQDGLVSYMEFAEFYIAVEEKKNKIRTAFKHFDVDDRGYVTNDEAREILSGLLGFSDEKCAKAIETYDKNQDGNIDYEEFLEFYAMLEEERTRLLSEFRRYDQDNDGRISLQEFRDMLSTQGYEDKEINTLMVGYDKDCDGYLNFDEFKEFLNFQA